MSDGPQCDVCGKECSGKPGTYLKIPNYAFMCTLRVDSPWHTERQPRLCRACTLSAMRAVLSYYTDVPNPALDARFLTEFADLEVAKAVTKNAFRKSTPIWLRMD